MFKPWYKSTSTRAVIGSTAATTGTVVTFIKILRVIFDDSLPWAEADDATLALFINTILIPIVSRFVGKYLKINERLKL